MTKYSFVVLNSDKDTFLERLQDLGVVDISRSSKPVDEHSSSIMRSIESIRSEIRSIETTQSEQIRKLTEKKRELASQYTELLPWGEYDIVKLGKFDVHFYQAVAKQYRPEWEEKCALQIVNQNTNTIHFVVIGDNSAIPLKEMPAPTRLASEIKSEMDEIEEQIHSAILALEAKKVEIPYLESQVQEKYSELNLYLATQKASRAAEGSVLVFRGFAPTENDAMLRQALEQMSIYWIAEQAQTEDHPPIKLRNNSFVRLFEPITRMYGMPSYNEFDPTVFLSIFFLLFFSICMGDAGYGLILVLVGLLLKGKNGSLAQMWGLIVSLGVGTTIVGLFLGGFFGINLSEQTWIPQAAKNCMITGDITVGGSTYAKQMVMALGIGVVHLCLALIVKSIWAVRQAGLKHSLAPLGWTLLVVGGVVALAIGLAGVISELAMKWLLIGIGAVSAMGIYFLNHWGKNPLVNFGSGLWDTYNMASGLMGDLLSYIRLYALALSGGMLGQTFNQIGEMVKGSDPTWQWIPFVLILLLGHAINLAMSCLGAFVHPLRLNFVEFFKNSAYNGKGAEYKPITK